MLSAWYYSRSLSNTRNFVTPARAPAFDRLNLLDRFPSRVSSLGLTRLFVKLASPFMDAQYTLNRMRCAPSRIHDFARAQVGRSCTHRSLSVRTITTACPFVAFSDVDAHEAMQKAPLRRAKNPQLLNLLVYKSINIIPHLVSQ